MAVNAFKHEIREVVARASNLQLVESHDLVSDAPRVVGLAGKELGRVLARIQANKILTARSERVLDEFLAALSNMM